MEQAGFLDDEELQLGLQGLTAELEMCHQSTEAVHRMSHETLEWLMNHRRYLLEQLRQIVRSSADHLSSLRGEVMSELASIERTVHRKQVLAQVNRTLTAVVFVHFLRWERFLLRLTCAINPPPSPPRGKGTRDSPIPSGLLFHVLRIDKDTKEVDWVRSRLPSDMAVLSIARLSKSGVSTKVDFPLTSADNPAQMKVLLRSFRDWSRKLSQRPSSGRSSSQSQGLPREGSDRPSPSRTPQPSDLLRYEHIAWMHPPSCNPFLWDSAVSDPSSAAMEERELFYRRFIAQHTSSCVNNYVYYCLEESVVSAVGKHIDPLQAAMMSELQVLH